MRIFRGFRTVVKIVLTVVASVAVTKPVIEATNVVIDRRRILNLFSRPGKRIFRGGAAKEQFGKVSVLQRSQTHEPCSTARLAHGFPRLPEFFLFSD